MVASAVFITDLKGKPLIHRNYRGTIPLSITDEFQRILVENDKSQLKPILVDKGITFCFVEHNDLFLLGVTKQNVNVMLMLNFLYKIIQVFEDYFEGLEQESIRDNFVLIYELFDEMNDFGYPQHTNSKILKHYICVEEKHKLNVTDLTKAKEVSTSITGNVPWRKCGIKSKKMGWSVGGAKDINNFRDCINKQILPKLSSLTYNGLFYDYYFENINDGEQHKNHEGMNKLFYPSYCYAKCDDDYYLSVGLNSNLNTKQFKRNKLNLMIILDVSGSMDHPFPNNDNNINDMIDEKSKIEIAKQCLINLISKHIDNNDRFCILLFNHQCDILQKFAMFKDINNDELIDKIKQIKAFGGTKLLNAYQTAVTLFECLKKENDDNKNDIIYDNRVIFLTDAKPNLAYNQCPGFIDLSKIYSLKSLDEGRICTTFMGIGIDFNTDLVNKITSELYGSNYYSVHSVKQFNQTMIDEFDLMVTPLIFNLKLEINEEGNNKNFYIDKIYGNDNNDTKNKQLMNVKTLFPSRCNADDEVKGGIILVKICPLNDNDDDDIDINMELKVIYENRFGEIFGNKQRVSFKKHNKDKIYYDNIGIRKGILLIKYVKLLKEWISTNASFFVSTFYRIKFCNFLKFVQSEMKWIGDNTLKKEVFILQKLIKASDNTLNGKPGYLSLKREHEIYLQVSEKINVVINNKNSYCDKILSVQSTGKITMNSSLSGMPEIKMGLYFPDLFRYKKQRISRRKIIDDINNCNAFRFHQCVRLTRFHHDGIISFIPPDGQFEILSYVIDGKENIEIPFDLIHSIKYEASSIQYDIVLIPKFNANLVAKDIIIKIPVCTTAMSVTWNDVKKIEYGQCKLEKDYLIWSINTLHFQQKPRLFGALNLQKSLNWNMRENRLDTESSLISVEFRMDNKIFSSVKIMYVKVIEKSGYKSFKKVQYITETDDVNNIKFTM